MYSIIANIVRDTILFYRLTLLILTINIRCDHDTILLRLCISISSYYCDNNLICVLCLF